MYSFKKFSDEKLLERYEFYRSLNDECISENDYLHAIDVWNTLKREG